MPFFRKRNYIFYEDKKVERVEVPYTARRDAGR